MIPEARISNATWWQRLSAWFRQAPISPTSACIRCGTPISPPAKNMPWCSFECIPEAPRMLRRLSTVARSSGMAFDEAGRALMAFNDTPYRASLDPSSPIVLPVAGPGMRQSR
jgi:hypothetical protein